jgi:beta-glucosidase
MATRFPRDFLWGAATSAHQVEGNNIYSDWWEWEEKGLIRDPSDRSRAHRSGAACRHYELYQEDFQLAQSLSHNAHRFSIEWARIEPQEGIFQESQISHYQEVLRSLRERGITPVVTLHHFTNPLWLIKKGGWTNRKSIFYFLRYTKKIVEALGDGVTYWVTINEPTIYAYFSYLIGTWPPQEKSAYKTWTVLNHFAQAHIQAYRFIHLYYRKNNLRSPQVGIANNLQFYQPLPDTSCNRWSATVRNKLFNLYFIKRLVKARSFDYIGLNYYSRSLVKAQSWSPRALLTGAGSDASSEVKKNSLGWDIYPHGLYRILIDLKQFNLPVIILENGICTDDDDLRWEFIRSHLLSVARAISEGVKVTGYFYWALLDNFEWDKGFGPRFGLVGMEYNTHKRIVRPSARKLASVYQTSELS